MYIILLISNIAVKPSDLVWKDQLSEILVSVHHVSMLILLTLVPRAQWLNSAGTGRNGVPAPTSSWCSTTSSQCSNPFWLNLTTGTSSALTPDLEFHHLLLSNLTTVGPFSVVSSGCFTRFMSSSLSLELIYTVSGKQNYTVFFVQITFHFLPLPSCLLTIPVSLIFRCRHFTVIEWPMFVGELCK